MVWVRDIRINIVIQSDHSIVYIQLKIEKSHKRGRGFFKFNFTLLYDREYVQKVKEIISNFRLNSENHYDDDGLKWDTLKCEIRGYTIAYAMARKKKRIQHELDLKERLKFLEENLSSLNYLEYSTIQTELEQINKEYASGIILRSKVKYMEQTEQNVSNLSKEEFRNYKIRHII